MFALALGQSIGPTRAATVAASFAVSVRVASACEATDLCGTVIVRTLGTPASTDAVVTPLAPTADRDAGQRIDTRRSSGPVEIDF